MTRNKLIVLILAICLLSTLLLVFFISGECEHQWSAYFEHTPPTLKSDGVSKSVCSLCGEERTKEIPRLTHIEHSYPNVWEQSNTHHWLECEIEGCGVTTVKGEHTWYSNPATGKTTCPICGREKDE